jgi:hypothetical protein
MLRRFVSPTLSEAAPELARTLKESKLQNCGCLGGAVQRIQNPVYP